MRAGRSSRKNKATKPKPHTSRATQEHAATKSATTDSGMPCCAMLCHARAPTTGIDPQLASGRRQRCPTGAQGTSNDLRTPRAQSKSQTLVANILVPHPFSDVSRGARMKPHNDAGTHVPVAGLLSDALHGLFSVTQHRPIPTQLNLKAPSRLAALCPETSTLTPEQPK